MWTFLYEKMKNNTTAIFFDEENKFTYPEIINMVQKKSEILKKLLPGSKCGILCEKGINCAISILACWRANLIPIVMSYDYGKQHYQKILELTQPVVLIKDTSENNIYHYEFLLNEELFIGYKDMVNIEQELNGVVAIMCTSGTTGIPKGVLIKKEGLQRNILSVLKYFKINQLDRILIARPLYHCAVLTGEFLVALYKGCDVGFWDSKYQPMNMLEFCCVNGISVLGGTPTLFNHLSLFIEKNNKLHKIKKIVVSGECLKKRVATNIRKAFKNTEIYHVYGLTEASPRVSYLPPDKFDVYMESVGIALDSIKISIVDSKGQQLLPYEVGEIRVKTPSMMKGYYRNIEDSIKTIRGKWLYTGDIGYKDENGYLYIVSRKDDMIIKGGMNIYPIEIEKQVESIKEIDACIAYGVETESGQEIGLDIVLNKVYNNIGKKRILQILARKLPVYEMPIVLNIVEEIVHNASGKVVRKRLFDIY